MDYYKVIDSINGQIDIDTKQTNYSLTLNEYKEHYSLVSFIVNASEEDDLPIELYLVINNNLASFGSFYLEQFPKAVNGIYEIVTITKKDQHKNKFVTEKKLIEIIKQLDSLGIKALYVGTYIWEFLYEKIRINKYPNKPSRLSSFFLFDNIDDCYYYIDTHKNGTAICKVEIIEIRSLHKGDMNLLDMIPNHCTYNEAEKLVDLYWLGEKSEKPVFEYVLQGKCNLIPL